ncbi:MAG: DUF4124 domain-containing protein [Rhodocyclaceae bacterium]
MRSIPLCLLTLLALSLSVSANAQTVYKWVGKDGKVHYSDQPPPKEIKKVEQPRLRAGSIDTSGLPYETQQAAQNFPVTLYTTPDCVSECANARDLLNRRGIPFRENSVVAAEDGEKFKKALGTDKLLFPSLIVGSRKQIGYETDVWHGLLDSAGYPRTAIPGAAQQRPSPEGAAAGQ